MSHRMIRTDSNRLVSCLEGCLNWRQKSRLVLIVDRHVVNLKNRLRSRSSKPPYPPTFLAPSYFDRQLAEIHYPGCIF